MTSPKIQAGKGERIGTVHLSERSTVDVIPDFMSTHTDGRIGDRDSERNGASSRDRYGAPGIDFETRVDVRDHDLWIGRPCSLLRQYVAGSGVTSPTVARCCRWSRRVFRARAHNKNKSARDTPRTQPMPPVQADHACSPLEFPVEWAPIGPVPPCTRGRHGMQSTGN